MVPTVVRFEPDEHLQGTIDVLLRVRAADPTYPPARDAVATSSAFSEWLLGGNSLARWVSVDGGSVLGFVQLTPAHDYITSFLNTVSYQSLAGGLAEIGKLFVDPDVRGRGVGSGLLRTACAFAWDMDLQPVLAVVATSTAARALYRREGLREIGSFEGIHGDNRVLVDERPEGNNEPHRERPFSARTL